MLTRSDKIFAIAITAALVGALVAAAAMALRFWHGMSHDLDPAAVTPLIIGVSLSLVVGALVVGVFLYGRRKEIQRDLHG